MEENCNDIEFDSSPKQCDDQLNPVKIKIYSNPNYPTIKNHSMIMYKSKLIIFGGFDGKINHNTLSSFDPITLEWKFLDAYGSIPHGRNGHTATLIEKYMYVIGGWLGYGPFASDEIFRLNLETLDWEKLTTLGENPGPCNMHSADLIAKNIYVFRGGNGKEYLSELHKFNTETNYWTYVAPKGEFPTPRANHSSAVIGQILYLFGGWDGSKRLNDLYSFDTCNITNAIFKCTSTWKIISIQGQCPLPRVGMAMTTLENKIYLFGGSGYSSRCFNDLHVFDPELSIWTQITLPEKSCIKPRGGHVMISTIGKLHIFGGSMGGTYHKDYISIDIDPPPELKKFQIKPKSMLLENLAKYCNSEEFSDITFVIEGKPFYGHRIILSLLSEKFRAMFSSSMEESNEKIIEIKNIRYPVFASICYYLYTGEVQFGAGTEGQEEYLEYMIDFLEVSDKFLLEEIKFHCQQHLINQLNEYNFDMIFNAATLYNAVDLYNYCLWFQRRLQLQLDALK